jgi:hypothetical protein
MSGNRLASESEIGRVKIEGIGVDEVELGLASSIVTVRNGCRGSEKLGRV